MKPDQLEEQGTPYVNVKFTTSHKSPLWWLGGGSGLRSPWPLWPATPLWQVMRFFVLPC